ncbi:GNAT family N-acetyltransferase [Ruania zhangjianzhongii]|uniref:GNAT family N-acetyltransferase n=1 Tax=Ruania zhangjianzhongii TaxID=2603206 RepID=UPI0011CAEE45|nr:GNAT family N-acetyltransferase [Ruania zhangjianzhongii]
MTTTYRSHRSGDAAALAALTTVAMPQDAVDTDWFTENVLLDAGFQPEGLIIAEHDGAPIGFVYAVTTAGAAPREDAPGGWLTIGCVHPDHRGRGVGTELLERAGRYLHDRGAAWVNVAAYAPAYFVPGLDAVAYPEAARLLDRHGFTRLYTAAAMSMELSTYRTPTEVLDLAEQREAEGYQLGPAAPDDLPEVLQFAGDHFAPDWAQAVRDAVLRHGHLERLRIVRGPQGIAAFAIYGAYRGLRERFGPFGVDESLRGTGLGKILLHHTLTAMRAEGAQSAWFLWTGEESPAGHLYRRTGFTVTRRFDVLRREPAHLPTQTTRERSV